MEQTSLSFPVFYAGLIFNRTIKLQQSAVNILLNGCGDICSAVASISESSASRFVNNAGDIPNYYCGQYLSLPQQERIKRIRGLHIHDSEIVVSAFHAFLKEKEIRICDEWVLELEQIIQDTNDPDFYIERVLWYSLHYAGESGVKLAPRLKKELRGLRVKKSITNLFSDNSNKALSVFHHNQAITTASAVPLIVREAMSALFLSEQIDESIVLKMQNGEYVQALQELFHQGRISLSDLFKWKNILQISDMADQEVKNDVQRAQTKDKAFQYDFDWFLRFFETAGNITSEEMQELWAHVLAGEIRSPGRFSLRTVETLYHMTAREALLFKNASAYILKETEGVPFLFCDEYSDSTLNADYELNVESFMALEECGLISALRINNEIEVSQDGAAGFMNTNGMILLFETESDTPSVFRYKSYPLTLTGRQLLSLLQNEADNQYLIDLGRFLKSQVEPDIRMSAYRVLSLKGNDIELDFDKDYLDE